VLSVIDKHWREHLREIDTLREGINLRAYGQKDPLLEYKQEAYNLFILLLHEIELETLSLAFKLFPVHPDEAHEIEERRRRAAIRQEMLMAQHEEAGSVYKAQPDGDTESQESKQQPVVADHSKPGRNDLCPCGSGKKYKNCHGREA
jgi:preprotein translocase subunit SecA